MNRATGLILLTGLLFSGSQSAAQTENVDSLWRMWADTTLSDEARWVALVALWQADSTITSVVAVEWILPAGSTDTLSRAYVHQLALARLVEGNLERMKGRTAQALAQLHKALSGFNRLKEYGYAALANHDIGMTYQAMGQNRTAARFLVQAVRDAEAEQDTSAITAALSSIAYTYRMMGEEVLSQQTYMRCLALAEGRDPNMEFEVLRRLYDGAEHVPSTITAGTCLERARALVAQGRVTNGLSSMAHWEANDLLQAGECESALLRWEHLLEESRLQKPVDHGWISSNLAKVAACHSCAKRHDLAIHYATEGLAVAHEYGLSKEAMDNLRILAPAYEEQGDVRSALRIWKQYYAELDSMNASTATAELSGALLVADFAKEQFADSLLNVQRRSTAANELQKERTRRNILIAAGLVAVVFGSISYRQRRRTQKALHRSDELLLNILPEEVAEELKAKGHADAKHFDKVTILFTDFKGFTEASEKLSPQDLVEELNTCFKAFDGIITARGIEKIKTIGDAYMCAGGLPVPSSSTPAGVVQAALEMQAFMIARKKERDAKGKPAFEMRVGIHTGPVVAGIVGVKKFQYDIWGDTVNTASRMESSGAVGEVNISESTYALVRNEPGLTFTSRGKVQAKGKGEMEMYFVGRSLGEG